VAVELDEDRKKFMKSLGVLSSIGISVVLAIAIGVMVGLAVDRWLGTEPWFFFIFLFIGIVAGFRNIFVLAAREIKRDDTGEGDGK
jgi:F0F1-type ATP synthase assembly protein I